MIPDDVVEEVRARADIVAIIGESVPLKKAGKDYKARCPFHDERTPSFYVVPSKGFYKCFGCGESGDAFTFVMKRQGLSFLDAVKWVGERSGVEVREVKRKGGEDPNQPLYEVTAFAAEFFQDRLWEWQGGEGAREYLEGRGISRETAERFGLGYAPDDWRAFREAAALHGIEDPVLLQGGLLIESDRSQEPYDRFRNRIVFPIESVSGRVVAFGGRVLGKAEKGVPKYLNSPESPIYHKGEILYGLSWAKNNIRRDGSALVVEGYMDVVSLAAGGLDNTVAPLGTSMTDQQALLLTRYCTRVFILFDSDPAGLRATFRAGDTMLGAGLHPAVVTLPEGEDPDTVVRKEGAKGLQGYLDQALDVLDRKLQILDERDYFSSIERTREAVDRLLPTLRAAQDPALRDIYVAKAAEKTGVRRETLESELARLDRAEPRRAAPPDPVSRPAAPAVISRMGAERSLLLFLLRDRERIEWVAERLGADEFRDPSYRAIFSALVTDHELDHPPQGMDPVAAHHLDELFADPEVIHHVGQALADVLAHFREEPLERRAQEIREQLNAETDDDRKAELVRELEELSRERRRLRLDWSTAFRSRGIPVEPHDQ